MQKCGEHQRCDLRHIQPCKLLGKPSAPWQRRDVIVYRDKFSTSFSEILSASSDVKAESPEQDHLCVTEITLADMRVAPDLERPSK